MNNKLILITCCTMIINMLVVNNLVNAKEVVNNRISTRKYDSTSASNLKLNEIMIPIHKLTRKRIIKLLIKSIKRGNRNRKKSENKSSVFGSTNDFTTRKGLENTEKKYNDCNKSLTNDFQLANHMLSSRQSLNDKINFKIKGIQLDIDKNGYYKEFLRNDVPRVLGTFIGDIVGVVIEEMLHRRGDKIADGIRIKISDIVTSLINKSNLTLDMAYRNLIKRVNK